MPKKNTNYGNRRIIRKIRQFLYVLRAQEIFGTEANKDLLRSFFNALLDGKENIKDLTYLNAEQLSMYEFERKAVFDVYCENEDGERFIVEMQKAEQ